MFTPYLRRCHDNIHQRNVDRAGPEYTGILNAIFLCITKKLALTNFGILMTWLLAMGRHYKGLLDICVVVMTTLTKEM